MASGFRVDVGLQSVHVEGDELLCVVGPTASQKTELAIRICERVDGEVISADSVQIYEGFDIGSGKPSTEQLQRVAHHLIGTASALEPVDAAHFALEAQRLVDEIRSRGRVPVVCGGTFMWVRALVYGLASAPKGDACVREALDQRMHEHGSRAMHQQLAKVDPVTASRLHPHDWVRIQRALEVFELTGKPLSQWHEQHQQQPPRHRAKLVGVRFAPPALDDRLRRRAGDWIRGGWIEEVRGLIDRGFEHTRPMGSVGYRQLRDYIHGLLQPDELLDAVVRATHVFARRQRTWLRDEPVQWLDPLEDAP